MAAEARKSHLFSTRGVLEVPLAAPGLKAATDQYKCMLCLAACQNSTSRVVVWGLIFNRILFEGLNSLTVL